jgi:hypothetical protein
MARVVLSYATMCDVKDCPNNSVAKGLCAKHYMRQRRSGDPNKVRKRGPASKRPMGVSARTWSRFTHAGLLFEAMGYSYEDFKRAMDWAKRRDGSFNVSKLFEEAERLKRDILEDLQEPVLITPPPPKD